MAGATKALFMLLFVPQFFNLPDRLPCSAIVSRNEKFKDHIKAAKWRTSSQKLAQNFTFLFWLARSTRSRLMSHPDG